MQVKELMIPLTDCAKIPEDRNLFDAIMMLEASRQRLDKLDYRPRLVLVDDRELRIVGSLRHFDVMNGLISRERSGAGKAPMGELIQSCRKALGEIFHAARVHQNKNIMYTYSQEEYVSEEASLEEGICKLVGTSRFAPMTRHLEVIKNCPERNEEVTRAFPKLKRPLLLRRSVLKNGAIPPGSSRTTGLVMDLLDAYAFFVGPSAHPGGSHCVDCHMVDHRAHSDSHERLTWSGLVCAFRHC